MMRLKAGKAVISLIVHCYHANRSPLLEGWHGIGKSELFKQGAEALKIECTSLDLSLMEPPDLVGLPRLDGNTTRYLPPTILPHEGKGILLFEEINRCERYMRSPCMELLTSRRLNDYRLPDGWLPAAAMNPSGETGEQSYEVDELDPALLSRFTLVGIEPDTEEWLAWARPNGVHPEVLRYVASDRSVFSTPESNPRARKYVSDHLWAAESFDTDQAILKATVVGTVGDKRGRAFLKTLKLNRKDRSLGADDVLFSYPQNRSLVRRWIKDGKLDTLAATLLCVKKRLQAKTNFQAAKGKQRVWANLGQFIGDLPGDMRKDVEDFFREHAYPLPVANPRRRCHRE